MASELGAMQTTVVSGSTEEVEARVTAIKANGGTLITVRIVKQDPGTGKLDVEITHT